ncbi:MAG: DUF3575 domain-containing protein [Ferruginibacter sp.]
MRKLILLACVCLIWQLSFSQDGNKEKEVISKENKNIIKLNLLALPLKNITLQYERQVARKITLAGNFRFMPKGSVPFKTLIKNAVDDPESEKQIDGISVGNFAFMPEVRFYVGRKGAFHGFYIAPFGSVANYNASLPYNYDDNGTTKTIPLSGSVTTITGGIMFGSQWSLSKKVYLDLWILGPNYGASNGKLTGQKTLTPDEQQSLKDDLQNLDVPLTKTTYMVDGNGATLNFKGPWAGVRSGLCIGIRF